MKSIALAGRLVWLAVTVLVAFGGRALAADMPASKPEVKKEIVAVIEAQLAAFRKGDTGKAHSYASSELRAQKPRRVFSEIVKDNYPEIWASTRAEFGIVRDDGKRATVTVQVYAKTGDAAYDYTLVKEEAGWRIFGVVRHEAKSAGKV
jgi:hypothetical protein